MTRISGPDPRFRAATRISGRTSDALRRRGAGSSRVSMPSRYPHGDSDVGWFDPADGPTCPRRGITVCVDHVASFCAGRRAGIRVTGSRLLRALRAAGRERGRAAGWRGDMVGPGLDRTAIPLLPPAPCTSSCGTPADDHLEPARRRVRHQLAHVGRKIVGPLVPGRRHVEEDRLGRQVDYKTGTSELP